MEEIQHFIMLLGGVIECAKQEKEYICQNQNSPWLYDQINQIVLPEIEELLMYARQGKVYFKYGKRQRMLESTYIIIDSIQCLANTRLGNKISELQEYYNKI